MTLGSLRRVERAISAYSLDCFRAGDALDWPSSYCEARDVAHVYSTVDALDTGALEVVRVVAWCWAWRTVKGERRVSRRVFGEWMRDGGGQLARVRGADDGA